jgi:capsular exopolysaccharide synthesis family protein
MDLRRILTILKRWIWLFMLGLIIAGGCGYYISNQQTPIYRAITRFTIIRPTSYTGYDYYSSYDNQQLISTYTQLLSTDALFKQASEELGFPVYGGVSADQIGDTQFVQLTVTHQDPQKAAAIANTLIGVLIDQNDELQAISYKTTESSLQKRADQALQEIESLRNQINQISSANLEEQLNEVTTQIEDLQAQVTDLEIEIANVDPNFATEAERGRKIELQAQLNQITPILESYQQLHTELVVMKEPIQREGYSSTQITDLRSTLNLYQQIYINSLSSLETLSLTKAQKTPSLMQVEQATIPSTPFSPRPMQTAALAGAIGFLGTAGIAFLVEYLDDTIKTPDDVKEILGLPVLGFVASMNIKGEKSTRTGLYVANFPRSPISEAFRALRTTLEFFSIDEPLEQLMITSANAEEGKTTVAINLAIILARSDKQVLLLDADMRRPNIHKHFDISNRIGLSDIIRGHINPLEAVHHHPQGIKNLDVITSGSLPPNPAELIASEKFSLIIEQLSEDYDMLIVDTPPAIVTDAQIISNKMDGVLYVLKPGTTRAITALTPLEEFQRVGAKMIGVIMNQIPRNRDYYYGGYEYYSPGKNNDKSYYRPEDMINQFENSLDQGNDSMEQGEQPLS